jgi:excisionase family DNA binding protein
MPKTLTFQDVVILDEIVEQQAADVIERTCDEPNLKFVVEHAGEQVALPAHLSQFMASVLNTIAAGGDLQVRSMPDELSTTVAAELLGVSRPTLMKMIREGRVPSHMVGSHHRLRWGDIAELQARLDGRRVSSARALRDIGAELGE